MEDRILDLFMNFGGFVLPYLEKLKRRSAGMPDMGDVDYDSSIGRNGFDTSRYGGYVSSGDDEVASGGNYGGAAIQHPHGRRGAINDLRTGLARPGGGVYEAAIRGLFDGQSPGWGGNNSDVDRIRRMNEQIRNAELQRAIQAGRSYHGR